MRGRVAGCSRSCVRQNLLPSISCDLRPHLIKSFLFATPPPPHTHTSSPRPSATSLAPTPTSAQTRRAGSTPCGTKTLAAQTASPPAATWHEQQLLPAGRPAVACLLLRGVSSSSSCLPNVACLAACCRGCVLSCWCSRSCGCCCCACGVQMMRARCH